MSSITYSERIKIETFCELGMTNIQMAERLKRSPSTISYELSRCQPYQAELAQANLIAPKPAHFYVLKVLRRIISAHYDCPFQSR